MKRIKLYTQADLEIALLSMIPGPISKIKTDNLQHCPLVARVVIFHHWKSASSPLLLEWLQVPNEIIAMETLVEKGSVDPEKILTTWTCWQAYNDSDDFQTFLN